MPRRERLGNNRYQSQQAGWSWGCVSAIDSDGQTIGIADAHRDNGKRFVVHANEIPTVFLELEAGFGLSVRV